MKFEAFFSGIKNANEVVNKLRSEGINAYADINDHYEVNTDARTKYATFLSASSNSDLVLNSGTPSENTDRSPMLTASPMVSGMGGFEEIADVNYKVIVDTDSNNKNKAEDIIKFLGGSMESPNVEIPNHIKNVDLSKVDPKYTKDIE